VTDKEFDEILKRAAQTPHPVDPALLKSVADSIQSSIMPVRPLAPTWLLASGAFLICAVVAIAGAAHAGFLGIEKLDALQRALIFSMLAVLTWLASAEFINQMIPGSRHRLAPKALLETAIVVMLAIFALLFRDYQTTLFVHAGIVCLAVGLLHAVPTALFSWLLLRRGFAVNSIAAGLAAGTLGGLAGVAMLELHCDNFQALHILLWHTAVVPASAAAGAFVAWALRPRPLKQELGSS
jgi:hypothetical protein